MAQKKSDVVNKILQSYKNKTGRSRLSEAEKREILARPANQKKIMQELRRYGEGTPEGQKLRKIVQKEVKPQFKEEHSKTGPIETFYKSSGFLQMIYDLYCVDRAGTINTTGASTPETPATIEDLRQYIYSEINGIRRFSHSLGKGSYAECSISFTVDKSGFFAPTLTYLSVSMIQS